MEYFTKIYISYIVSREFDLLSGQYSTIDKRFEIHSRALFSENIPNVTGAGLMLQQAANVRPVNIGTGLWCEEPSLPVKVFIQFLEITSPKTGYFITETRIDAAETSIGLSHLDHIKNIGKYKEQISNQNPKRGHWCVIMIGFSTSEKRNNS